MAEKSFLKMIGQQRTQIYILIGFCIVLYFFNLSQWDLWNPDEPRYGQVAREIVNGGDWILMHNNGKMYTDKPPLFFWLIAFSSFLWQGFSSFSVRFPSAFFGTMTVLLAFLFGKRLSGPRSGFFSGMILATSFEFAYLATRANIDATLAFFTTASLFCFFEWHQSVSTSVARFAERPSTSSGRTAKQLISHVSGSVRGEPVEPWTDLQHSPAGERDGTGGTLLIYGFYVGMALATLTKGPVGFILPLLVSLIYLAVQRDWKRMKAMKLVPGFLLLLVIVLAWYLPAVWKGGQVYLNETLFKHTLNRYAGGWSHVRPFYYYLYNFPAQFLPWALFLPGAFVYGLSEKEAEKRKAFLFFFVWFVVIFLFFSMSKGKRELYVLPLYPAAAVMVGKLLDDFLSKVTGQFSEKWITIPLYGWMAVMLLAGAAAPLVLSKKFPAFVACSIPMAIVLIGGSVAMFLLSRSRKYYAIFFLIIGIVAGGFFYTLRVVFPLVNPYKSGRYISEEITSRIRPGDRVGLFGGFGTGPYNFYTKIVPIEEMEQKDELLRFLQSPQRVFCILKSRDFSVLQELPDKPPVQLISQGSVGYDKIVLISNR